MMSNSSKCACSKAIDLFSSLYNVICVDWLTIPQVVEFDLLLYTRTTFCSKTRQHRVHWIMENLQRRRVSPYGYNSDDQV